MSISDAKIALRHTAREKRRIIAAEIGLKAALQLADNLAVRFRGMAGHVVSGYLPIGSEIDVVPALSLLEQVGLITALPVIIERDQPLRFRRWTNNMGLEFGPFNTRHPPPSSTYLIPDILLLPMLAFDSAGYRIGWGGGYYDRTLFQLRELKPIAAVGAAFSRQRVDKVPCDHHDARLDYIATELGITEIERLSSPSGQKGKL